MRRYSALLSGRTAELARFMHDGLSTIHELALGGMKVCAHFAELTDLSAQLTNTATSRLRAQAALAALHIALPDSDLDPDTRETERRAAAVAIATKILHPPAESSSN